MANKKYIKKRYSILNFSENINSDDNEYSLKFGVASSAYNIKVDKGILVEGCGVQELTLPINPTSGPNERVLNYTNEYSFKKMWRYKYYSEINGRYNYILIAFGSDNKLHYFNMFVYNPTIYTISNFTFNEEPVALNFRVNGQDVIGFCSSSDPLLVWYCDKEPYQVEDVPKFDCICLHNDRLFAIDSQKNYLVRYSSNLNPLDWTNNLNTTSGGVIELNDFKGLLRNLISFLDNIYVFRDFGISKISSYAANSVYTAVNIYNSSAKIYCNTACICGKDIYFLAEDGLYKFDGYNVERINVKFLKMFEGISQDKAVTCFFNGKLYIACNLHFDDNVKIGQEKETGCVNNALIEYEIESGNYNITRGIDVANMLAVKDLSISKLFLCLNNSLGYKFLELNDCGTISGEILPKKWESGKVYFEKFDTTKILKEINLICKYDCSLEIQTEKGTKTFNLKGKEDIQRVLLNCVGKVFSFRFISNSRNFYISTLQFVFNVGA